MHYRYMYYTYFHSPPKIVHWLSSMRQTQIRQSQSRKEHQHTRLKTALDCSTTKTQPLVYISNIGSPAQARSISHDEIIILGLGPAQSQPKDHGLNCSLSRMPSFRSKISDAKLKQLERHAEEILINIKNTRSRILEQHWFLTIPIDYARPGSLKRILPIDRTQEYQEQMKPLLEELGNQKYQLLEKFKKASPKLLANIQEEIPIPSYNISRPTPTPTLASGPGTKPETHPWPN